MKRSAKTTKIKEVGFNDPRSRPVHNRGESSTVKPSLHPWYYVKGRPDLTEKNISSRREREDQKHRQSVSNSQYFDKQMAETQVYHKWNDNKSLKHNKQALNGPLKPPYDVLTESVAKPRLTIRQTKELEKKYSKAKQKLTEFMQKFKELDENHNELEKRQNILVFQLKEMRKIKTTVKEKTQNYQMMTKCLAQNRFKRDKLRKKVFHIIQVLNHYKISVQKILLLKNCKGFLTDEELVQLTEVIERALKIIQMYIDLNENRNKEFQNMFDEEAETHWDIQVIEWQTEYEVWNTMTEKLIQSFINVVKEKLSQLLAEETTALEQRQQTLKELIEFTAKIKADSNMSTLMTENIEDFLSEINHNNN